MLAGKRGVGKGPVSFCAGVMWISWCTCCVHDTHMSLV